MTNILKTARDLLTWRTDLPAQMRRLPSTDFVENRYAPASYTDPVGAASALARVLDPDAVKDVETKVSTIYACIRLIATAMSEAPLAEYAKDANGRGQIVSGSWIADLLEEPNEEQG